MLKSMALVYREVKRSVSNGEILRDLTTYLCCVDPYPQSQQRHKIDNFFNKVSNSLNINR